jgi:hypothetical protein
MKLEFFYLILIITAVLMPGKHNSTPITACTGYNPAQLTFTTAPSGGQPPYGYQWQLNNTAIPGEILASYDPPQIMLAGTYNYNCTITDADGTIVFTLPKIVTIVPDPQVTVSGGGSVCFEALVTLMAIVTDGTGTTAYQWQFSPDNVAFTTIPGATASMYSPSTSIAGTLFYRVNIFPAVGSCNNATSTGVPVTVNPLPSTSLIYHF